MNALAPSKLLEIGSLFNNPNASRQQIASNASKLICGLYCDKAEKVLLEKYSTFSLNELRYLHYCKGKKKKISLLSLYHQLREPQNNTLSELTFKFRYGWEMINFKQQTGGVKFEIINYCRSQL